jgi:uncharacterized protein (DUF1501 family)
VLERVDDSVLVVIQLSGGNDGLNTVVPFMDDVYARCRPTLRLSASGVRIINASLGLHPRMPGWERLFKEGRLSIVQGVGCPGLSRDHEQAMRVWQTGFPDDERVQTGWLGRAADVLWTRSRPLAPGVFVGRIACPGGLQTAAAVVPAIRSAEDVIGGDPIPRSELGQKPAATSHLLRHVEASVEFSLVHQSRFARVHRIAQPRAGYPDCGLADDLRLIARMIRAEMGVRVFYAELGGGGIGGFDNHANQRGNHGALLEQLSESTAAFVDDLRADGLLERVLLVTFSEFGRTVTENGRRGTDHGSAGPMFLAGGAVRGGVVGSHPSLTDLDGDALRHQVDFRSVYAAALDWLSLPSESLLGGSFARLELAG